MNGFAPILSGETVLFVIAGFVWLRSSGYTLAEAGAGAVIMVFMTISLIHQLSFFLGSVWPSRFLEMAGIVTAVTWCIRQFRPIGRHLSSVVAFFRKEPFPMAILFVSWGCMAAMILIGWISSDHPTASFAWKEVAGGWRGGILHRDAARAITPLNTAALFFHGERFGLSPHVWGIGLMAHVAAGLSAYALARRYAWPPMALTITLMVLAMPRLLMLARWPDSELIMASAVTYAMVLIYRLVEQHRAGDLLFFLLCISFSISVNPLSLALCLVMFLLLILMMIRRHGWIMWRELMMTHPFLFAIVIFLSLALAQIPVFAWNLSNGHHLFGTSTVSGEDGILGAVANLLRYLLICFDPTEPFGRLIHWLIGLDLKNMVVQVHRVLVVFLLHQEGGVVPFTPIFSGDGGAGFGPFAMLLFVPAMAHALIRGPRRLKAVNMAWLGYLYICALMVTWSKDNIVLLTPLFAANGFVVAFFLPPWRIRRRGMQILQTTIAVLLAGFLILTHWLPDSLRSM